MSRIGDWAQRRWVARAEVDVPDDNPAIEFQGEVARLSDIGPRTEEEGEELRAALRALGADRRTLRLVDEFEGLVGLQGVLVGKRIWAP